MITSWNEMPIGVLQQINDIDSLHCSDDEKTFMATALLAGMEYDDFIQLPLEEATALVGQTTFVHYQPRQVRVRKEYQIGRRTYTLHKNIMEITTAQYINFQAVVGMGLEMHLPELMAIVLIPKGHKYGEGYDMEEVTEEIRDYMGVEDALSVADFFISKSDRLMRRMLRRSEAIMAVRRMMANKEEKEMMTALEMEMKLANDALRSGFGYRWRKQWPK